MAVVADADEPPLPFADDTFDLVVSRPYALAEELGRAADRHKAFVRYQERMRPFVELNQALATENPGGPASEAAVQRAKNAFALDG